MTLLSPADRIARLKREIAEYEREACDERAWGHHRAYARQKASEMRHELIVLEHANGELTPTARKEG